MKKVFAIILNWNQPKLTIECVESLQKQKIKNIDLKIIIVDNGSTDDSVTQFRALHPKKFGIEVMETNQNLGFAGGNNLGISYALQKNADYVLALNNDTIADSQTLAQLVKTIEQSKTIGAVSPKIYFAKGYEFKKKYTKKQLGNVIWYAGGKMDWNNIYGSNKGVDEVDKKQYNKQIETDFITGACVLFSSKALKEAGLFDEKYFMYLEDADLSQRLKNKGYKIVYDPSAKLWHKVAQSSSIGSSLNDYFISRNRLMFGFRYAKLRTKLALIRESLRLFITGRHWQAVGIRDFYVRRFGKGSWE